MTEVHFDDRGDAMELYARLLGAYGVGTAEALSEVVAPDVTYVVHGNASLSGTYHGVAGMLEWMQLAMTLSDGTVRFAPRDVTASDSAVLTIGRATLISHGTPRECGHIYHLRWADGLLVEGHTYPTDEAEFDLAWS